MRQLAEILSHVPPQWMGRERSRQYTKAGTGRMPHTRTSKPVGSKLWRKCPFKRRDFA